MTDPSPAPSPDDDPVRRGVQRHAGIAALRQLRRLVDAERAGEESDRQFVRRFLLGFGLVVLAAVVAWLWFRGAI